MIPRVLLATPNVVLRASNTLLLNYASLRTLRLKVKKRDNAAKNYEIYNRHDHLKLAERTELPNKWKLPEKSEKKVLSERERRLLPLSEELSLPYHSYDENSIKEIQKRPNYYDPLFQPDIIRDYINPQEEPFKSIYADSQPEGTASEYTKVKNITTPELWSYVERLARLRIAPKPDFRHQGEPIEPTACGYIPPPDSPPDLAYFVARTRNYVLPVYYHLDNDPQECCTIVRRITGDLWEFESDLRNHLEGLCENKKRILTSVREPFGCVLFRGKYLTEVVDWLHQKGF